MRLEIGKISLLVILALGGCGGGDDTRASEGSGASGSGAASSSASASSGGGAGTGATGGGTSTGAGTGGSGATGGGGASTGGAGGAATGGSGGTGSAGGGTGGTGGTGGNNMLCVPGETSVCYGGPAGTAGIGACKAGVQTCNDQGAEWGPCVGEVLPKTETCNTPEDDDCDGQTNEDGPGCACLPNEAVTCYTGPPGTLNVGACAAGVQICNDQGTAFGPCTGDVLPLPETCDTPEDDDCDGQTNEGGANCLCVPGSTTSCYTGPAGTLNVGACHGGTKTCSDQGTSYGPCTGEVTPASETCNTAADDDCNGQANEGGVGCACVPGSTASCYSGPAGTQGVGACHAGTKICNPHGTGYGACTGEVTPGVETCNTPVDDDCNGQTNEGGAGCACTPGSTTTCYSGPAGTQGVGTCVPGTKTCNAQGTAYGACAGEVTPQAESCATLADENCDGQVNEGCACLPNTTASCYNGPAGTQGVGTCTAGTKTCNSQGTAYGACVGEVTPQADACGTLADENCDGEVNEGCACLPNTTTSCYSGPAGTQGVGICTAGTKTCNAQGTAYGACTGEVLPQAESCGTVTDDDCDGQVNEGCACAPNSTASCYSGPAGTQGVGPCTGGTHTCNAQGTAYGPCTGEVTPQAESCLTAVDDDCDGQVNEGCICVPNSTASCYSGPAGTQGVGVCQAGTRTCNALGTAYGACAGEVTPGVETCNTPVDDDCNGLVNEGGAGCVCTPNSTASCYTGPPGTQGVGACHEGTRTCNAQGTGYGACAGEVTPVAETCSTPVDDDCNGQVNEGGAGCVCTPNSTASCYTGPAGTQGVGACHAGTKTCNAQGTAYGSCAGEVTPVAETCNTAADDDCDGQTNEGGAGCVCAPNSTASCYTGPAGTQGVGACAPGIKTCNAQGTAYGSCAGEVTPVTETCNTAVDDDCNGQTNEGGAGCVCAPGSVVSCYTGPAGTQGVGACMDGTKTCNALGTAYGACNGQVTPTAETCNTAVDDDCNGQTNEGGAGCVCAPSSMTSCYSGAAGTNGVGPCHGGTKTCNGLGTAYGSCAGEVTPIAETCNTPVDDDCNGQTNEGGAGCVCTPNAVSSCYTGPAGTQGVGNCAAGSQTCNSQGTALGACAGDVTPKAENCAVAGDENCDGSGAACAGSYLWSKAVGSSVDDEGASIATDASGNVIVGAYFTNTSDYGCGPITGGANGSALIVKLDSAGNCLWNKVYGSEAITAGLTVDGAGNILAIGSFKGSIDLGGGPIADAGNGDVFAVKLGPDGSFIWGKTFGDAGQQQGQSVAVDPSNNVLLIGYFQSAINFGGGNIAAVASSDVFVAKLTPAGAHVWSKGFGGSSPQLGRVIASDSASNVYIGGEFGGSVNFGGAVLSSAGLFDVFLAKLTPAGAHVWSKQFGDAGDSTCYGLGLDASGNVYAAGAFTGTMNFGGSNLTTAGGYDVWLAKLDTSGGHLWSKRFGGAGTQNADGGLAVDAVGNVTFSGALQMSADYGGGMLTSAGGDDAVVAKYDANGAYLWAKRFGTAALQAPKGIAVDASSRVLVTGVITGATDFGGGPVSGLGGEDLFVVALGP